MTKLPLEGIRILDATDVWAGPYTCTLLGDLGAEVIKVDSIQRFGSRGQLNPPDTRPDGTPPVMWAYPDGVPRTPGAQPWNRVALYNGINRNKLGITLNLQDPQGKDLFKRIAAISDVVIDNYATGVFARLGLGYEDLKVVKEDIIVISMPLFGNYGTYSQYKGLGSTADPISGHATLRGYLGEDPTGLQGTVHSDAVASSTAPFAAMAAIFYRNRTGKGQFIDFGQCEAYMGHLGEVYLDYTMNGRVQSTRGNRHESAAPHGCYRAKGDDSWVIIAVTNDEEWERFCEAIGNPPWTEDPRFATSLDRHANQDALDAAGGAVDRPARPLRDHAPAPVGQGPGRAGPGPRRGVHRSAHQRQGLLPGGHPQGGRDAPLPRRGVEVLRDASEHPHPRQLPGRAQRARLREPAGPVPGRDSAA